MRQPAIDPALALRSLVAALPADRLREFVLEMLLASLTAKAPIAHTEGRKRPDAPPIAAAAPAKQRGWPLGKPRGPRKATEKATKTKVDEAEAKLAQQRQRDAAKKREKRAAARATAKPKGNNGTEAAATKSAASSGSTPSGWRPRRRGAPSCASSASMKRWRKTPIVRTRCHSALPAMPSRTFSNCRRADRSGGMLRRRLPWLWFPQPLAEELCDAFFAFSNSAHRLADTDKLARPLRILNVSNDRELDVAFASILEQHIGGLIVEGDVFLTSRREQLILFTTRHAIPTVSPDANSSRLAALMSYGTSLAASYRLAGVYVARILKGAKPADLPVQQSATFETVLNLKAARALGLTIPTAIPLSADEVIE